MKKIFLVFVSLILVMSLTACAVKLTEAQSAACDEVEEALQGFADLADNHGTKREIKKVDGKIVYIGTIDYAVDISESIAVTFQQSVMPLLEGVVHKEDIYIVLYLKVDGETSYRLVDSQLDASILD